MKVNKTNFGLKLKDNQQGKGKKRKSHSLTILLKLDHSAKRKKPLKT
jgi:hypothetical protein